MNKERSGRILGLMIEAIGRAIRTREEVYFFDHDCSNAMRIEHRAQIIEQLIEDLGVSVIVKIKDRGDIALLSTHKSPFQPSSNCAWCGSNHMVNNHDTCAFYSCSNKDCKIHQIWFTAEEWENRGKK
jgi:hypothetical protein